MKTGCDTCDTQGPEISKEHYARRELHRALHDLGRELLAPMERLATWLDQKIAALTKRGN